MSSGEPMTDHAAGQREPSAPSRGYAKPPEGLATHASDKCTGQHCCIHSPSPHHMVTWPMHWRSDKGQMERICEHGVGHPDPDDAAYWERLGQGFRNIHGCDGCCRKPKA
jgi:hypothetical protein